MSEHKQLEKPEVHRKLSAAREFGRYILPAIGGLAVGTALLSSVLLITPEKKVISIRDKIRGELNLPKTDLRQYAANEIATDAVPDVMPTEVKPGPELLKTLKNEVHVYDIEKLESGSYKARVAFKDSGGEFKSLDMRLGDIIVTSFDGVKMAVIFAQVEMTEDNRPVAVFKTFSGSALNPAARE